jgi:elongation factor 1-beta
MAVSFANLNSEAGLKKLDEYLLTRSYITGYVIRDTMFAPRL